MSSRYSWTQPACPDCYAERMGDRRPATLLSPDWEECVYCGQATNSGIYVRVDPARVAHPTRTKD